MKGLALGLSRCGTEPLKSALEDLAFKPTRACIMASKSREFRAWFGLASGTARLHVRGGELVERILRGSLGILRPLLMRRVLSLRKN